MPATKDQHVAWIDFHEKMELISLRIKNTVALIQAKKEANIPLTADDLAKIAAIRQTAIDATRRAQDEYFKEMEGHK
jgi:hypothetical protein